MNNIKVTFPKTNVVNCVFSIRQSNNAAAPSSVYDKYDRRDPRGLKRYSYRVPEGMEVSIGDVVLVHCQTGYQLCEVVELNVITALDESKLSPLVCHVDLGLYYEEVDKAEAAKVLHAQLMQRKKEIEAQMTYDLLAERDPVFAELLKSYRALGGKA